MANFIDSCCRLYWQQWCANFSEQSSLYGANKLVWSFFKPSWYGCRTLWFWQDVSSVWFWRCSKVYGLKYSESLLPFERQCREFGCCWNLRSCPALPLDHRSNWFKRAYIFCAIVDVVQCTLFKHQAEIDPSLPNFTYNNWRLDHRHDVDHWLHRRSGWFAMLYYHSRCWKCWFFFDELTWRWRLKT